MPRRNIWYRIRVVGPFTLDEIVGKVRKELELFDYIFDQAKQNWVLLMEHADLAPRS